MRSKPLYMSTFIKRDFLEVACSEADSTGFINFGNTDSSGYEKMDLSENRCKSLIISDLRKILEIQNPYIRAYFRRNNGQRRAK